MFSVFEKIITQLHHVRHTGPSKATAHCPGHNDTQNSLSISVGDDGRLLLKCFAGCEVHNILITIGWTMSDLFEPNSRAAYQREKMAADEIKHTDKKSLQLVSGCTLAQYASRKQLPEQFLHEIGLSDWLHLGRSAVRMEYRDIAGINIATRYRTALENDASKGGRFLWEKGSKPCPYGLWLLSQARNEGYIVVVEGESDAQTLWYHDIPAIGIPGASMWKEEWAQYFDDIASIFLVVEPDNGGKTLRGSFAKSSLHPRIRLIQMAEDKDPSAMYLSRSDSFREDWAMLLANGVDFASTEDRGELNDDSPNVPNAEVETKKTAAQRLIEIGNKVVLFRSQRDEAFACFPTNGHSETWPLRSKSFRKWLSFQFYTEFDKPPNTQAMEEAIQVLEAKCGFHGEEHLLSLRMAQSEGALWLDLADDQWQAVRITAEGWAVVQQPPLLFRRYAPASAQIVPKANGSMMGLRQFVNVKDESLYCQLVVWLVSTFFPEIAHPVLVVYGEQGSAKSTLMRLLALLVDPSKVPLRAEPRDIGEWLQAADHSYMVTLDNVSNLRAWLSDALCRAVTGEGFTKRQLYSDADDVIISFRRVVAITGIEVVPERADLFDRALLMELDPIKPEQRRLESEVLADFDRLRPELLGGLLDLVAGVLRELPSVRLDCLPRMADFARIGVAVERVLQWPEGTFIDAYSGNIAGQHEEALAISAIGEPLQLFMKKHAEWSGTAKELLDTLGTFAGETSQKAREWPKSARAIGGLLRRAAPNLRAVGINVNFLTPHGKRLIHLTRIVRANTVPMAPSLTKSPETGAQITVGGTHVDAGGTHVERISRDWNARNIIPESLSGSDCFGLTDGDAPVEEYYDSTTLHPERIGNDAQSLASRNPRLANERVPVSPNVSSEQQEILATKKEDYDPSRGGLAPPGSMETSNQSQWNNDEREDTLI